MKKRKTAKRKSNSSKKCKMSLKQKEFMALTIFAFFIFAFLLAVTNNSQQNNSSITGHPIDIGEYTIETEKIGTFFSDIIDPAKANETVMKWILFFSLSVGLIGLLSIPKNEKTGRSKIPTILKLIAFPIAYGATYLITKTEIFGVLLQLKAITMAILVGGPLIAMILLSIYFLSNSISPLKVGATLVGWYFYLGFMIYYFLFIAFLSPSTYDIGTTLISLGGMIVAILVIVFNKKLRKWIKKLGIETKRHNITMREESRLAEEKYQRKRSRNAQRAAEGKYGGYDY